MMLITGANGQLGRELCQLLGNRAVGLCRADLELCDPKEIQSKIESFAPTVIINCAAYTAVDAAENDQESCIAVNATAVKHLAEAATTLNSVLVQVSTDYLFAGENENGGPIDESRIPTPRGVYAVSKFEGERYAALCPRHLIIRTCGLYGITPSRRNFVETMLRLGKEREELSVVCDQHCSPTSTRVVAEGLLHLLELNQEGVFNVVCSPGTSWCNFAREIFRQTNIPTRVREITTEQYGAAAPRPFYSVLDTTKFENVCGYKLPSVSEALATYLESRSVAFR